MLNSANAEVGLSLSTIMIMLCVLSFAGPQSAQVHGTGQPLGLGEIKNFLRALEGTWDGRAVLTPVGPLPYNMSFTRTHEGAVSGNARPGAAIHYWKFYPDQDGIRLRFLTTFQGNTKPLFLTAVKRLNGGFVFRANEPAYLAVHVSPQPGSAVIKVYLRDKLHVRIELSRVLPEQSS